MRRHYVKVPPLIQQWFPGGAPADWQRLAFEDATERGTCLTVESLPANDRGVRAALHGDRFYFEIGRDSSRKDAFFLMRIYRAHENRLPRTQPRRLSGEFRLWPGGSPAILDVVDDIFGVAPEDDIEVEEQAVSARPSPLLIARLSTVGSDTRHLFRPGRDVPEPDNIDEWLEQLRKVWARYRLDRYATVSPRSASLLRGRIKPSGLDPLERQDLLSVFGIATLNSLAVEETANWAGLLESLATIPLNPLVRGELWATMLIGLDSTALRRELYESANELQAIAATPSVAAWQSVTLSHIVDAARRASDDAILGLSEGSHRDGNALSSLATWALRLEFVEAPQPIESRALEPVDAADREPLRTQAPAPTPDEVLEPASATSEASPIDRWVLRLHGQQGDVFESLARELRDTAEHLSVRAKEAKSVSGFLASLELAASMRTTIARWGQYLPDAHAVQQDFVESKTAYEHATSLLGSLASEIIEATDITPTQLVQVADLVARPERLREIPGWMWGVEPESRGLGASDIERLQPAVPTESDGGEDWLAWAVRLSDAERLERVRAIVDFVDQIGQPTALRWIPKCPDERLLDDHLRDSFRQVREFLDSLSPDTVAALTAVGGPTDLSTLQHDATWLEQLRACLPASVFTQIQAQLSTLADPSARSGSLAAFGQAADFIRREFGGLDLITYEMLAARVRRHQQTSTSVGSEPVDQLTIDHNWTETTATKATLVLNRPDPSVNYGFLAAPLILEKTGLPAELDLQLEWTLRREGGWPAEWPLVEPTAVRIPVFAWHPFDRNRHQFPFQARFPIRVPSNEHPKFEATVSVRDNRSGQMLCGPKTLRWESISVSPIPIALKWRDETSAEYVRQHPIGPQERAGAILERLRSGSSVAVLAPRRFGKSTLVEYLAAEANKTGLFVPPPIVCTWFAGAGTFDHEALWARVHHSLHERLGSGLSTDRIGALPDETAFDHARRAAKQQGSAAIVLLFDEAQLFFPQHGGHDIASRLKTLLERHWNRSDDSKVPVVFGLIGLPSLVQRAGADLMGLMSPIFEKTTMDEAELRPLIARMAAGLQTTRGARVRLAETSGNLLILRAMLENLAARVGREQRVWTNYDDVVAIEEWLERELQVGRQQPVASYVRDVLNSAERVEEWSPLPAFAVALALAATRTRGQPFAENVERVVDMLNHWCAINQTSSGVSAVYTAEITRRHLQQLEERGVIDASRFSSNLLEAWLVGIARRGAFDDAFRQALFAGAQRQIELPQGALPVATGGEATILRKGDLAFRVRPLASDAERAHFDESAEVLRMLRAITQGREAGSPYIFELIDIGLSTRNGAEAVQVYRWVDGKDLSGSQHAFSVDLVADVGVKLGRALKLLHRYNVLHRDLCPRNIILDRDSDESIRPVLIDFGFAKLASLPMRSVFAGPHLAPEVKGPRPNWTRAADVYSLAWTLDWLLDPAEPECHMVQAALAPALVERPDLRLTADGLLDVLLRLEDDRRLVQRRDETWAELMAAARPDLHLPWFAPVLREAKAVLVAMTLGLYRADTERFRALADLLFKIGENCPSLRGGLKQLRAADPSPELDPVAMTVALRNARAHSGAAEWDDTRVLREAFEQLPRPKQSEALVVSHDNPLTISHKGS